MCDLCVNIDDATRWELQLFLATAEGKQKFTDALP